MLFRNPVKVSDPLAAGFAVPYERISGLVVPYVGTIRFTVLASVPDTSINCLTFKAFVH